MSALANIFVGIGGIVHSLIGIYIWMVIIAALSTWIPVYSNNTFVQMLIRFKTFSYPFLMRITEPAYNLVRRMMRTDLNGIDMAPLIIIIGLQVIDIVLLSLLNSIVSSF